MTPPSADVPIERLVAHRDFVRALARTLVRDPHRADDLEQDVWATTLARPPKHGEGLRGWFRRIARSRAVDASRGARRRDDLHATAAASARRDAPDPAALAARFDAGRCVAAAVARLDEPYRGTVLLRFYDDLEPAEIAARTGTPVETVRTRLRRAVERLREELDRGPGGRDAWMAALVPLAAHAAGGTAVSAGAGGVAASGKGAAATITGGVTMAATAAKTTVGTMTIAALAAAAGAVVGSFVTIQVAAPDAPPAAEPAIAATEIRDLRRRLEATEAKVAQAAASVSRAADGRFAAQEARIAELETASAAARKQAGAAPLLDVAGGAGERRATAEPAPAAQAAEERKRHDADKREFDETLAALRRKVADPAETEAARLAALTALRRLPGGIDGTVVFAARDLFRASSVPATRDTILRDLHRLKDDVCPGEVKGLYVAGLRDPDESVRLRAAEDCDTFSADPDVRRELEIVKSGDASDHVRSRAAKTLEADAPRK